MSGDSEESPGSSLPPFGQSDRFALREFLLEGFDTSRHGSPSVFDGPWPRRQKTGPQRECRCGPEHHRCSQREEREHPKQLFRLTPPHSVRQHTYWVASLTDATPQTGDPAGQPVLHARVVRRSSHATEQGYLGAGIETLVERLCDHGPINAWCRRRNGSPSPRTGRPCWANDPCRTQGHP